MNKRYFTLEQAEKILPEIKARIKNILKLNEGIKILESSQKLIEEDIQIEFEDPVLEHFQTNTKLHKNLHKLYYEFYKETEEVEKLGCVLKSLNPVLVDFLSVFEDRDVFLCWKESEERIENWHEIGSGFENRNPIFKIQEKDEKVRF